MTAYTIEVKSRRATHWHDVTPLVLAAPAPCPWGYDVVLDAAGVAHSRKAGVILRGEALWRVTFWHYTQTSAVYGTRMTKTVEDEGKVYVRIG